ncbi:MAG: hypothetical protein IPF60_09520 [Betaproteobacteria bacterium]|nr:hypothetical protein [Betaproteobacteria bacterium]
MRVVIVGLGKSGTTALLYAIRGAMPVDAQVLFEPHAYVALESPHVAAKVLLHPNFPMDDAFFRQFDRVVLLVRDPRDLLISKALYRIYGARGMHGDPAKVDRFVELLRAKEADPGSVPITRINALFESLAGLAFRTDDALVRLMNGVVTFHRAFPECLVYKYESMVAARFEPVAQYLSLPAEAMNPQVPDSLRRVVRSRRAGNWRDWFCPEDVEHYRPLLSGYMERYDYPDDWVLNPEPHIRPEECSEYVLRLDRERRSSPGTSAG